MKTPFAGFFLSCMSALVFFSCVALAAERRSGEAVTEKEPGAPRDHILGLSGEYSSLADSSGGTTTTLTLSPKIGWNWRIFEAGPALTFSSVTKPSNTTTSFSAGGFFDWNFIPNVAPEITVPGLGLRASAGGKNVAGTSAQNSSTTTLQAGLFLKRFLARSSSAVRVDLLYESVQTNTSNSSTTTSGPRLLAGLDVYY